PRVATRSLVSGPITTSRNYQLLAARQLPSIRAWLTDRPLTRESLASATADRRLVLLRVAARGYQAKLPTGASCLLAASKRCAPVGGARSSWPVRGDRFRGTVPDFWAPWGALILWKMNRVARFAE